MNVKTIFACTVIALILLVIFIIFYFLKHPSKTYRAAIIISTASYTPHPPTLSTVFMPTHDWIATLSANHIRILAVTGDIIPARSVNNAVVTHKNPLWPYEKVADTFRQKKFDSLFINLESPLTTDCKPTIEGMVFCGETQNVQGLHYLGVTVANLANNHQGNYGTRGIESTVNQLDQNNILHTGTDGPVFQDIRGIRFAYLGYNSIGAPEPGISWADDAKISSEIAQAKQQADIVIVQFHWGIEYQSQPSVKQIELGHLAINSGADLVIGNHPHWIEPIEFYKGKLITYAHGNFVFDQMWSQKTREGVIGWYTFYDKQLVDVAYLPLQIDDYGQPHFVDGAQKESILADMKNQSLLLSTSSALAK